MVFMAQPPVVSGGGNNERGRNLRASVRNVKRWREVGVAWRTHDEAWVHRYTPFLDQPVRFKMERPTELRHRCHKPPRQVAPSLLKVQQSYSAVSSVPEPQSPVLLLAGLGTIAAFKQCIG